MLRLALALAVSTAPAGVGQPPAATVLAVDGAVSRPLALNAGGLAALPRAQVTATIHGVFLTCSGAWLADVLATAGVPSGEAVRGPALALAVVARGADGYRTVFSLGEIDRGLGRGRHPRRRPLQQRAAGRRRAAAPDRRRRPARCTLGQGADPAERRQRAVAVAAYARGWAWR